MPNGMIYKAMRRLLRAQEDEIPKLYMKLLLPEAPVVVDAGAHVGSDTIAMSRLWPRGTIHAFEPVPALFQKLTANTAGLPNVHRYPLALGPGVGTAEMFVSGGGSDASSSLLPPKEHLQINPHVSFGERITVQTSTLDAWARENGAPNLDFLWLDMQGAELAMLKAAPRSLSSVRLIHLEVSRVEVYEGNPLYPEVRAWLEAQGFRLEAEEIPAVPTGETLLGQRAVRPARRATLRADPAADASAQSGALPAGRQGGLTDDSDSRQTVHQFPGVAPGPADAGGEGRLGGLPLFHQRGDRRVRLLGRV